MAEILKRLSVHPWALSAWPAFLGAAMLEVLVFAWVDPAALPGVSEGDSALAVYTLAFFVFWAVVALACVATLRLAALEPGRPAGAER